MTCLCMYVKICMKILFEEKMKKENKKNIIAEPKLQLNPGFIYLTIFVVSMLLMLFGVLERSRIITMFGGIAFMLITIVVVIKYLIIEQ